MKVRNTFVVASATLAALVGITVGMTHAAQAQGQGARQGGFGGGRGGQQGQQRREAPLAAALKAAEPTDAQKTKIEAISKKYREQTKALLPQPAAGAATTPGERPQQTPEVREKLQALQDKAAAEVKAVLTPEQQTKFQAAYDAAKAQRGNQRGGGLTALADRLKLTDDQKTKITPILADTTKEMQALRSDTTLDRQAQMQKMTSIWEDAKTKIRPLLTPDQQKTLDDMKSLRGGRGGAGGGRGGRRGGGAAADGGAAPATPSN